MVNFFSWASQGGHSEQLLFFALFYQSTPSCLKVGGGLGWGCGGGGPCDYCVIPSPFGLDFGTLDFGTSDLGLTIHNSQSIKRALDDILSKQDKVLSSPSPKSQSPKSQSQDQRVLG